MQKLYYNNKKKLLGCMLGWETKHRNNAILSIGPMVLHRPVHLYDSTQKSAGAEKDIKSKSYVALIIDQVWHVSGYEY